MHPRRPRVVAAGIANMLVLLLTMSASGAGPNDLELWLSTNGNLATPVWPQNPVLPAGFAGTVYLWARTAGSFQTVTTTYVDGNGNSQPWSYVGWVGMVYEKLSIDSYATRGFTFGGTIANPGDPARWLSSSDFSWATGDPFEVWGPAPLRGLGGTTPPLAPGGGGPAGPDNQQKVDGACLYSRVGAITISNAPAGAELYMVVGPGDGHWRRNGEPGVDRVYFGVGDAGVDPTIPGAMSAVPDLTVAPEPGAIALVGLGAVMLRRW